MSHRDRPGAAGVAHPPASADSPSARNGAEAGSLAPERPNGTPADRARAAFAALAQGLPTLHPEPVEPIDRDLDAAQLDAVARALHTPDVALIRGGPGTGKSRVIAEIIRQEARRGRRVLLAAPTPAALDVVLDRLTDDAAVTALRCVARDERPEELPPASAARTFASLAAEALTCHRNDLAVLERLAPLATRFAYLKAHDAVTEPDEEFARRLSDDQARHDGQLRQLDEAGREAVEELGRIQKRIAELDAAGRKQPESQRGWLARLLPFGAGRTPAAAPEGQEELDELRAAEGRIKRRADEVALQRQQLLLAWHEERQRCLDAESARRRAELAACEAEVRRVASSLSAECPLADPFDPAAVAATHEALARSAAHGGPLRRINLAAVPLAALDQDEALAELTCGGPFDLLILDEAHEVAEADLDAAARRSRRWVLVGEPAEDARPGRGPAGQYPWPRLWRAARPRCWRLEGGRHCVRLLPLAPGRRRELEVERVADAPEIELRIWAPPGREPRLAEVLFPAGTSVDQALQYLYRELDELPALSAPARWSEGGGRLTCRLFDGPARPVPLAPGLAAHLQEHDSDWRVAAVEFDAGWDREAAEVWTKKSLRFIDAGRAASLDAQHRMAPAVGAFACALGFAGVCPPARPEPVAGPAAEFIPVPALADEARARRRGDVGPGSPQRRLPPLRGGAGLDVDLADPRSRERLPPDLLAALPPHGFINMPEAEAIVRLLENLIDDRPASAAVLPLYEAQAALVRQLVVRSATLAASPVPITVATPESFRQREAEVVIVGLTRSHGHRAVSYGEGPGTLALALTRARQRLILVGDPGTLARRATWDGPLEQLDADAAHRERGWVAALVRLLQRHGPPVIQLREGSA